MWYRMNFPSLNTESNTSSLSVLSIFYVFMNNQTLSIFTLNVLSSLLRNCPINITLIQNFLSYHWKDHIDMIRIVSGCLQGLNSSQLRSGCVSVFSPPMSTPVWRLNCWSKSVHSVRLTMQSIHACVEERKKKQIMYSVEESYGNTRMDVKAKIILKWQIVLTI